jgi:hypothetical protein
MSSSESLRAALSECYAIERELGSGGQWFGPSLVLTESTGRRIPVAEGAYLIHRNHPISPHSSTCRMRRRGGDLDRRIPSFEIARAGAKSHYP